MRDAANSGLARRVSSTTLDATEEGAANFFAVDHSQHVEDRRAKRNAVQSVIFGVVSGNYGEKSGLVPTGRGNASLPVLEGEGVTFEELEVLGLGVDHLLGFFRHPPGNLVRHHQQAVRIPVQ